MYEKTQEIHNANMDGSWENAVNRWLEQLPERTANSVRGVPRSVGRVGNSLRRTFRSLRSPMRHAASARSSEEERKIKEDDDKFTKRTQFKGEKARLKFETAATGQLLHNIEDLIKQVSDHKKEELERKFNELQEERARADEHTGDGAGGGGLTREQYNKKLQELLDEYKLDPMNVDDGPAKANSTDDDALNGPAAEANSPNKRKSKRRRNVDDGPAAEANSPTGRKSKKQRVARSPHNNRGGRRRKKKTQKRRKQKKQTKKARKAKRRSSVSRRAQ